MSSELKHTPLHEGADIAIRVQNLSKCYHIYDKPRDRLMQMLARGRKQYFREFWALKDVSFEVKKGETVGIIGRNGSGKSTLLQMICGTLNPTSGSIQANGRIAALLELGSGFNPEFTGRENVYMNGAILGLGKEEIDSRFDDIAAFADIGEFIEQPVKTYSSGMMVRLAFSVAINVEPEILIVDEALSVGDEIFQRKCFSRIEAIRAGGATILFVSHSGAQIVELCDRAVLMDAGEELAIGSPKTMVGKYQKLIYAPSDKRAAIRNEILAAEGNWLSGEQTQPDSGSAREPMETKRAHENDTAEFFDPNLRPVSTLEYESHGVFIESPKILTLSGENVNCLCRGKSYRYTYKVRFTCGASKVRFGMLIKTASGLELGGAVSASSVGQSIPYVTSGTTINIEYRFTCPLNPGTYFLNAGVTGEINGVETYLHRILDFCMFKVMPVSEDTATAIIDFGCAAEISFERGLED
jgi:lipopolysaccharide transport system ATP-binding protein